MNCPSVIGFVGATIHAPSDAAMRRLIGRFVEFLRRDSDEPALG